MQKSQSEIVNNVEHGSVKRGGQLVIGTIFLFLFFLS